MTWTFGRWQSKIWDLFPRAVVHSNWQIGGPTWAKAVLDQRTIDTWEKDEVRGPDWYRGLDRLSAHPHKGE